MLYMILNHFLVLRSTVKINLIPDTIEAKKIYIIDIICAQFYFIFSLDISISQRFHKKKEYVKTLFGSDKYDYAGVVLTS